MTPLERGQLWVMRVHAALASLVLLVAGAFVETILSQEIGLMRGAILLPLLVPVGYAVFLAPGRRFRAWGYAMEGEELQLVRGVWNQVHTMVPLDRVQHIDVAQGPIERACGVTRLIVHTAGTMHSQVVLPGLARDTAERMRDEIRARIRQEEA